MFPRFVSFLPHKSHKVIFFLRTCAAISLCAMTAAATGVADDITVGGQVFGFSEKMLHAYPQHQHGEQDACAEERFAKGCQHGCQPPSPAKPMKANAIIPATINDIVNLVIEIEISDN